MENQQVDLSEKFKLIRTRERLTQKEMAELLDLNYQTYSNYERGTRRAISVLEVIKVLNHPRFKKYLVWFITEKADLDEPQQTPY